MRNLILISLILLLSSCVLNTSEFTYSPAARIPVGSYIIRGQQNTKYGCYGYVLFTLNSHKRGLETAQAFLDTLPNISSYSKVDPKRLMVTSWPLNNILVAYDASSLVDHYDYGFAIPIIIAINKLDAVGPVLVAFDTPNIYEAKHKLILDMSKFSDEEIKNAFLIWRKKITTDPKLWSNGFDLSRIKIKLRSFLNKYGESILIIFSA